MVLNRIFFIGATVAMLASCGGPHQKPASTSNGASPDGAAIYSVKCALCHGDDGARESAGAKNLQLSTLSLEEVAAQVRYGKGAMPPQNGVLTDAEIDAVSAYVMTMRKK